MLCLSGFELHSRWVPLEKYISFVLVSKAGERERDCQVTPGYNYDYPSSMVI